MHSKEKRYVWTSPVTNEGSSEDTILGATAELLNPLCNSRGVKNFFHTQSKMPQQGHNGVRRYPEVAIRSEREYFSHVTSRNTRSIQELDEISRNVVQDMNRFGLCVVNNFLGLEKGLLVLNEVLKIYDAGMFKNGQLVSNKAGPKNLRQIRGDEITWVDGRERFCENIGRLISKVDAIIMRANKMANNGKMGNYKINNRTKVKNFNYIFQKLFYVWFGLIIITNN